MSADTGETNGQEHRSAVLTAINRIFRERIRCGSEEELAKTCLTVAEELTGSQFGFIGEVTPAGLFDTIAISDPGWGACKLPGSDATMLIRGMDLHGIWATVVKTGEPLIAEEPSKHPDWVGVPQGHPPLVRFLGVPLIQAGRTIGMMALANKPEPYSDADLDATVGLALPIVEAIHSKRVEERIARQSEEILEISTPVMRVWEGVVVAPLIGTLDSDRTQVFMERLLEAIVASRSPVALVDITAVPTVDTQTAQHLIETITAARLLGAEVVLTGVKPAIAQTLVHLGVDLSGMYTKSSLAAGLLVAFDKLGLEVVRKRRD